MLRRFNIFKGLFNSKRKFETVYPAIVNPIKRHVPDHIEKPSYHKTGEISLAPESPDIKNDIEIKHMTASCRLASSILNELNSVIRIGITTDEIDEYVHNRCIENNAYPSPLNYRGFPKSICTSVNNVACHGIPDNRPLINGDIINVDITVYLNGHHGDCSKMYLVGDVDDQGKELVGLTKECLLKGISICGPDVPFKEIGFAIEFHANIHDYCVIPSLLGHGIGSYFHGPPEIYHTGNTYPGVMKPGMTFTIEPALSNGDQWLDLLDDGWTAITSDGARSAQAEHTILINENGYTILTDKH